MIDKIKSMSRSELRTTLIKVQNSMLDNKEKGKLYDAIDKRNLDFKEVTSQVAYSDMTLNEMGIE